MRISQTFASSCHQLAIRNFAALLNGNLVSETLVLQKQPTIFALSTAPGRAGIAVIRVSGPKTSTILDLMTKRACFKPRFLTQTGIFCHDTKELLDQAMVVWLPGPKSYTGEDMCELHVHGSPAVVHDVIVSIGRIQGCVLAEPGEFTKRALLNSKLNLVQVEGLSELLNAQTSMQRRVALRQSGTQLSLMLKQWRDLMVWVLARIEAYIDFGEDDMIESTVVNEALVEVKKMISEMETVLSNSKNAERLRSGFHVVVAGEPNAGKSSLVNKIAGRPAAIVASVPGTTRDTIDLNLDLSGYPVILTDTAGLRQTDDPVEIEGVRRARERISQADLILLVVDSNLPNLEKSISKQLQEIKSLKLDDTPIIVVLNKCDRGNPDRTKTSFEDGFSSRISCETNEGIDNLLERTVEELRKIHTPASTPQLTRTRQLIHLSNCVTHLKS